MSNEQRKMPNCWNSVAAKRIVLSISLLCLLRAKGVQCRRAELSSGGHNNQHQHQYQHHQQLQQSPLQLATGAPGGLGGERCRIGAPVQWRAYLDAASKAHLAPAVAVATLKQFSLAPIQLTASSGPIAQSSMQLNRLEAPLLYHAQSINNVGVLIEATFQISTVLKRTNKVVDLKWGQLVRVHYKVSASLSTTSDIIALANEDQQQPLQQTNGSASGRWTQTFPSARIKQPVGQAASSAAGAEGEPCALELSEHELVRKGSKLFKTNQDYVLFLDQVTTVSKRLQARAQTQLGAGTAMGVGGANQRAATSRLHWPLVATAVAGGPQTQARFQQQAGGPIETVWTYEVSLHPFASHEPLNNQTSRSIHKILCRNCARTPQVQLLNSTVVGQLRAGGDQKVRLDCRVEGNPMPWVEWFRNGKLLRNKRGRYQIKWSRTRTSGGQQVGPNSRLSRLEVDLRSGKNETGIYECRAMNVAAREPVVGAYTLLLLPEQQFALVPVQEQHTTNSFERHGHSTSTANDEPLSITNENSSARSSPFSSGSGAAQSGRAAPNSMISPTAATGFGAEQLERRPSSASGPATGGSPQEPTSAAPLPTATPATSPETATTATATSSTATATATATTTSTSTSTAPTTATSQSSQTSIMATSTSSVAAANRVDKAQEEARQQQQQQRVSTGTSSSPPPPPVVVGQPCPREANENFCLNKGTCVLIGHIEEYFCNCAEGYHGHRCEYKSLGHQQTKH